MDGRKRIMRIITGLSGAALTVSIIGFVVAMGVDTRADDYRVYGELPLGAETTMHLPAGDVNVSVHSQLTGVVDLDRMQMPILQLRIEPAENGDDPRLDNYNGAKSGDERNFRKQIWIARIPVAGDYVVRFVGDQRAGATIGPLVNPQLAFGKRSSAEDIAYRFLWMFAASVVGLMIVPSVLFIRRRLGRGPGDANAHAELQLDPRTHSGRHRRQPELDGLPPGSPRIRTDPLLDRQTPSAGDGLPQ